MIGAPETQKDKPSIEEMRRQKYPELVRIVQLAETAPAELQSLALIRVATQPTLADTIWKHELLQEAFESAANAYLSEPVTPVSPATIGPIHTLPSRFEKAVAMDGGLDRLSLQISAAEHLGALDPKQGFAMLQEVAFPEANASNCESELIDDPTKYFLGAAEILPKYLRAANAAKHADALSWLQQQISRAASPTYLPSLLKLPISLKLSSQERDQLILAVAAVMTNASNDSRAWSVVMSKVTDAIGQLFPTTSVPQRSILLRAWRAYLVNGFSTMCQDELGAKSSYVKSRNDAIAAFNQQASNNDGLGIMPISKSDTAPGTIQPGIVEHTAVQSPVVKAIQDQWWHLEFKSNGRPISDDDKRSPEWADRYEEYLTSIENLSSSDLPAGDDEFWWKSSYMSAASMIAPPGQRRDAVMARYLGLLTAVNITPENFYEWYTALQSWIELVQKFGGIPKEKVLSLLASKGNSLTALIASLERLPQ